ncbi:hypothetical protein GCM10022225_35560 [Plantactinospora mayteni]|uniref:DUF4352 domain-containing protein n=1 Tax=Plantactinospora mayteni TaxID=566021 RepID=A0ABQ4EMF6_9ACTN|nr:hypothetical protein [Plantactinospora mayteni]GIG95833.1 hypothetical protein Pma05_24060 [Plantactinospora mayteni]
MGVFVREQRRVRIAVTAMMSVLALTSLGCGFVRDIGRDSSGSDSAPGAEKPTSEPTYDSNATGEVVGTNCRYDDKAQLIKFDLSIQNSSADHAFKYSFTVDFTAGESEFATDSLGSQFKEVTVAPDKDRTLTVSKGYQNSKRFWYGCAVERATKTLAG